MDARPEQLLRRADLPGSRMEHSVQMNHIGWSAVGQAAVRLVPDVLGRIEFRGVGWEVLRVDPRMLLQETADFFAAVDGALIPEQKHRPPKVSQQMAHESQDIQAVEGSGLHPKVKCQMPLLGRDRQSADGRDVALLVPVPSVRRLSFLRPGSFKVRNEQEATLVEENQVRSQSLGVFLYSASDNASSARSPLRPAGGLDARASDNSTPGHPSPSRRGRDDTSRQNASESNGQSALTSTTRWDNRRPKGLSPRDESTVASVKPRAVPAVRRRVGDEARSSPCVDSCATTGTRSLRKPSPSWLSPVDCVRASTTGWRAGGASPIAREFRRVSCNLW